MKVPNAFRYSYRLGRSSQAQLDYKFDREIQIKVYEFDPRGAGKGKVVDEFTYSIPEC